MQKIISFATFVALAACQNTHQAMKYTVQDWPALDLYTTFKADASLFSWDGKTLSPYKDITATIKLDSDRNKIKVDAKVAVPLIGKVNAEVLVDATAGMAYEYVPFLGLCQKTPLNKTVSLKALL
jgi:hypothetical protein